MQVIKNIISKSATSSNDESVTDPIKKAIIFNNFLVT